MDLIWLIEYHLSQDQITMFFQFNESRSFTQSFQVERVGHMLLDMIKEEGWWSAMYHKKMIMLKRMMVYRSSSLMVMRQITNMLKKLKEMFYTMFLVKMILIMYY